MRNIFIPIVTILILAGGYFLYKSIKSNQRIDIWDIVPENTIGIFEVNNFKQTEIGEDSISEFGSEVVKAFYFLKKQKLNPNDSSSIFQEFANIINQSNILLSASVVGSQSIDLTLFIDLKNGANNIQFQKLIDAAQEKYSVKLKTRSYKEIDIYELNKDELNFSYVIYDGYFIGSFTPYLVEDAIRTVLEEDILSFKEVNPELFNISKLVNDQGNLYFNGAKLKEGLGVFLGESVNHLPYKSAFYDLSINQDQVFLNGFSYMKSGDKSFLGAVEDQKAQVLNVKRLIPNNSSFLYHVGVKNVKEWIHNSFNKEDTILLDSSKHIYYQRNKLERWLGSEIALVELESNKIEKLLFFDVKDENEALNQLNTLAEKIIEDTQDTIYYEDFAEYTIKELRIKDFPEKVFGSVFSGFEDCFYTIINNYLVLSNSVNGLKVLINEIENENTWGRSLEKSRFIQSTMSEANISFMFDLNKVWGRLLSLLNENWRIVFEENSEFLRQFPMGSIQFSNIDNKFYSSIVLKRSKEALTTVKRGSFDVEKVTYLESNAVTKPFVVRNHLNNSFETLVQDSLTNLYLISKDGEILWTDSIGESIIDDVVQIDYYKNRKLQYFFATKSQLHLIDRNGKYVEGFPFRLEFEAASVSVIDYDNSKHYRFLISNLRGDLYIFDKALNNLEGWQPRVLSGPLSENSQHIRVRGKDLIIAAEKEGIINVLNRRGESYKGFPKKFNFPIRSSIFADINSNFNNSTLNLISPEGELISINLNGEILFRKQFYKPSKETQFKIAPSNDGKSFVIYRYDKSRLSILDVDDNIIFGKDYLDADITDVQYYNLGVGREVYAVTDSNQQFTYIYNHTGELINFTPINSGFKIGLLDFTSTTKKLIYTVFENNLTVYSY